MLLINVFPFHGKKITETCWALHFIRFNFHSTFCFLIFLFNEEIGLMYEGENQFLIDIFLYLCELLSTRMWTDSLINDYYNQNHIWPSHTVAADLAKEFVAYSPR